MSGEEESWSVKEEKEEEAEEKVSRSSSSSSPGSKKIRSHRMSGRVQGRASAPPSQSLEDTPPLLPRGKKSSDMSRTSGWTACPATTGTRRTPPPPMPSMGSIMSLSRSTRRATMSGRSVMSGVKTSFAGAEPPYLQGSGLGADLGLLLLPPPSSPTLWESDSHLGSGTAANFGGGGRSILQ